jgi:hypothetical protein
MVEQANIRRNKTAKSRSSLLGEVGYRNTNLAWLVNSPVAQVLAPAYTESYMQLYFMPALRNGGYLIMVNTPSGKYLTRSLRLQCTGLRSEVRKIYRLLFEVAAGIGRGSTKDIFDFGPYTSSVRSTVCLMTS